MRKGTNPQKDVQTQDSSYCHQLVIPVFIPNDQGYFEQSFEILESCLTSLFKTIHSNTFITIVNNGSGTKVSEYLERKFKEGLIHEYVVTENIGKINAVLKGIVGHSFPLITVSDADVMFLNGWQEATYEVFENFPEAGFVTPVPNPKLIKYHTLGPLVKHIFSKKLRFQPPKDRKALERFATSIENERFFKKTHLENALTLTGKTAKAVIAFN